MIIMNYGLGLILQKWSRNCETAPAEGSRQYPADCRSWTKRWCGNPERDWDALVGVTSNRSHALPTIPVYDILIVPASLSHSGARPM